MRALPDGPRLLEFPGWFANPYLTMLLLAPRAAGWNITGSTRLDAVLSDLETLRAGDVFHIHWTTPVLARAVDESEADDAVARFAAGLSGAKRRGVYVVWSVHNVLPHEVRFARQETELARLIERQADLVHVLSSSTADAVAPKYALSPHKIRHIPHSSYLGAYDDRVSREEARAHFGLEPTTLALLSFGQAREYKGADQLVAASGLLASAGRNVTLLIAGAARRVDRGLPATPLPPSVTVQVDPRFVPDAEVQLWFRAADAAVFPFRSVLNTGSVHLAATFGCRAVMPALAPLLAEFGTQEWVTTYDPTGGPDALAAALSTIPQPDPSAAGAAVRFAREHSPWRMSQAYLELLDELRG